MVEYIKGRSFLYFSHEERFDEYEKDKNKFEILKQEYEQTKKLEKLLDRGEISEYVRCTFIDMSNKVLGHIAVKYDSVKEEIGCSPKEVADTLRMLDMQ